MPRVDLALALGLAVATALSRIPFRARLLPTWDAVQFALALERYDLLAHQPHPPGYILYVAAARIADVVIGDATASLVWLSIIASGAAIFFVYRLAWMLYGRPAAVLAAIGFATSPLFWFYGEVGLPYAVEAALASMVAMLSWPARCGHAQAVLRSAVGLGLAGGVRQSLLPLFAPLWATTAWAGTRRFGVLAAGATLMALTTALWLFPMLHLAGGLGTYLSASAELFDSTVRATTVMAPGAAWLGNARAVAEAAVLGLGLLLPVLVWAAARAVRSGFGPREWFLLAWLVPPLVVYVWFHFGQYGYLLAVLPALYVFTAPALAAALTTGRTRHSVRIVARAALVGIAIAHVGFVIGAGAVRVPDVAADASWLDRRRADLLAEYRYRLWSHTVGGLREAEAVIAAYIDAIGLQFAPAETVIVTELGNARSYPWFRHAFYYLRRFRSCHLRLPPWSHGYLDSARLTSMAARPDDRIVLGPGVRHLVWMVDFWNPRIARPPGLRELPLTHGRWLYVLDVDARPLDYAGYHFVRSPGS
jgi:Protein of unknown function (DUF2723)